VAKRDLPCEAPDPELEYVDVEPRSLARMRANMDRTGTTGGETRPL
jgi:hypothetical protein